MTARNTRSGARLCLCVAALAPAACRPLGPAAVAQAAPFESRVAAYRDFARALPACYPAQRVETVAAAQEVRWHQGDCVMIRGQLVAAAFLPPCPGELDEGRARNNGRPAEVCSIDWMLAASPTPNTGLWIEPGLRWESLAMMRLGSGGHVWLDRPENSHPHCDEDSAGEKVMPDGSRVAPPPLFDPRDVRAASQAIPPLDVTALFAVVPDPPPLEEYKVALASHSQLTRMCRNER